MTAFTYLVGILLHLNGSYSRYADLFSKVIGEDKIPSIISSASVECLSTFSNLKKHIPTTIKLDNIADINKLISVQSNSEVPNNLSKKWNDAIACLVLAGYELGHQFVAGSLELITPGMSETINKLKLIKGDSQKGFGQLVFIVALAVLHPSNTIAEQDRYLLHEGIKYILKKFFWEESMELLVTIVERLNHKHKPSEINAIPEPHLLLLHQLSNILRETIDSQVAPAPNVQNLSNTPLADVGMLSADLNVLVNSIAKVEGSAGNAALSSLSHLPPPLQSKWSVLFNLIQCDLLVNKMKEWINHGFNSTALSLEDLVTMLVKSGSLFSARTYSIEKMFKDFMKVFENGKDDRDMFNCPISRMKEKVHKLIPKELLQSNQVVRFGILIGALVATGKELPLLKNLASLLGKMRTTKNVITLGCIGILEHHQRQLEEYKSFEYLYSGCLFVVHSKWRDNNDETANYFSRILQKDAPSGARCCSQKVH